MRFLPYTCSTGTSYFSSRSQIFARGSSASSRRRGGRNTAVPFQRAEMHGAVRVAMALSDVDTVAARLRFVLFVAGLLGRDARESGRDRLALARRIADRSFAGHVSLSRLVSDPCPRPCSAPSSRSAASPSASA
jgi:hypothetical protein